MVREQEGLAAAPCRCQRLGGKGSGHGHWALGRSGGTSPLVIWYSLPQAMEPPPPFIAGC